MKKENVNVRTIIIQLNKEQQNKLDTLVDCKIQGITGVMRTALDFFYNYLIVEDKLPDDVMKVISNYKKIIDK